MRTLLLISLLAGCHKGSGETDTDTAATDPGALVDVSAASTVGVLLDEFPAGEVRDRVAGQILAQPDSFWQNRAKMQLRLTELRLIFRFYYYDESENKRSLPLPPEEVWNIALDGAPTRTTVNGHDLITVGYHFTSTLFSDATSPGTSEPALGTVGGTWDETFTFPIDPTLLLQRTGYACMDEDQYPPESVDAENAFLFYDDTCDVETPDTVSCHYTALPDVSCVDAVDAAIGSTVSTLHFERKAWDATRAEAVRVGEITSETTPDLKVLTSGLAVNRVIYRYFPADSCAIADGCIVESGWRRVVTFDSHDQNVGGGDLYIGPIDYYGDGEPTENADHGMYEWSECHEHYHFQYYGDFSFGSGDGEHINKNGFCLESTDRLSNNQISPLNSIHYDCSLQGVDPGWGDLYQAGLTCNWVDLTGVDTRGGPVTDDLTFHSNPDGFLCEGTLKKDADGNQIWEATDFTTSDGSPVDRPACDQTPGADANDIGSVPLTVPPPGQGMLTSACTGYDQDDLGPHRNCGFAPGPELPCEPGSQITLSCSVPDASKPGLVRVCDFSEKLGAGVACEEGDALGTAVLAQAGPVNVQVACPAAKDAEEPGGHISVYTAPLYSPDGDPGVVCTTPN